MLNIYCTNRFETLSHRVARLLERTTQDPFAPAHLIVPSASMRRALSMDFARRHGVAANLQFDFLAQWLWTRVAAVVPKVQRESPYAAQRLGWRLFGVFSDLSASDSTKVELLHPRLINYLGSADELMRYELAMHLGRCFEQYTTYRSDWLEGWQSNRLFLQGDAHPFRLRADERWQAQLWRMLQLGIDPDLKNPVAEFIEGLRHLSTADWQELGQPAHVQVIALPSIPPLHARMLCALGEVMQVHLHVMNPCKEYWFDLVDARRLIHLERDGKAAGFEEGHPLLSRWGKQTQAHVGVLVEAFVDHFIDEGSYLESRQSTLLGALQDSILHLRKLGPGSLPCAHDDPSIEIHACHSLIRQLEVLHNRLLSIMAETDCDLGPDQILVVLPELEAAVPLIDAVFGAVPEERRIAYRITGLSEARSCSVSQALLDLLSCVTGRAGISQVLDLLSIPSVAAAFDVSVAEQDLIRDWMREAGVHWGLDQIHRSGYPGHPESGHTLAEGLDRLFLSYACGRETGEGLAGLWPASDIQGSQALLLGKLAQFSQELSYLALQTNRQQTSTQWHRLILDMLDRCIAVQDRELNETLVVRRVVSAVFDDMRGMSADHELGPSVVLRALTHALSESTRGSVPTGAITFCSPGSLRYLPFKVIAFLGLDDGVFPSHPSVSELDLMEQVPRWGDRQLREDERNVFLDLLLSARERFILGYTAFNIRDNAVLPPSVILSELLDVLERACPDRSRQTLVISHPMQAFDRRAFLLDSDSRIRSHDAALARAWQGAESLSTREESLDGPPRFFVKSRTAVPVGLNANQASFEQAAPVEEVLKLEDVLSTLCDTTGALLNHRTGLRFVRDPEPLQDQEPLVVATAVRRRLERLAVHGLIAGQTGEMLQGRLAAMPGMPHSRIGKQWAQASVSIAETFVRRIKAELEDLALPECPLDWLVPSALWSEYAKSSIVRSLRFQAVLGRSFRRAWVGRLEHTLRAHGLVLWAPELTLERALLSGWINHLALQIAAPVGATHETRVHTLRHTLKFHPLVEAPQYLCSLLALAVRACEEPVPFFPRESLMRMQKGASALEALWFDPRPGQWSQAQRPEVQLVWRGQEPPIALAEFEALALQVYTPLLAACEVKDV